MKEKKRNKTRKVIYDLGCFSEKRENTRNQAILYMNSPFCIFLRMMDDIPVKLH